MTPPASDAPASDRSEFVDHDPGAADTAEPVAGDEPESEPGTWGISATPEAVVVDDTAGVRFSPDGGTPDSLPSIAVDTSVRLQSVDWTARGVQPTSPADPLAAESGLHVPSSSTFGEVPETIAAWDARAAEALNPPPAPPPAPEIPATAQPRRWWSTRAKDDSPSADPTA